MEQILLILGMFQDACTHGHMTHPAGTVYASGTVREEGQQVRHDYEHGDPGRPTRQRDEHDGQVEWYVVFSTRYVVHAMPCRCMGRGGDCKLGMHTRARVYAVDALQPQRSFVQQQFC